MGKKIEFISVMINAENYENALQLAKKYYTEINLIDLYNNPSYQKHHTDIYWERVFEEDES